MSLSNNYSGEVNPSEPSSSTNLSNVALLIEHHNTTNHTTHITTHIYVQMTYHNTYINVQMTQHNTYKCTNDRTHITTHIKVQMTQHSTLIRKLKHAFPSVNYLLWVLNEHCAEFAQFTSRNINKRFRQDCRSILQEI